MSSLNTFEFVDSGSDLCRIHSVLYAVIFLAQYIIITTKIDINLPQKMASTCLILRRGIATSCVCHGKRNFRKFLLYNKRGSREFKEAQVKNPDPDIPIDKRGVRDVGFKVDDRFISVPEMIPELIVPSLEGFTLKPYVSYRVEEFDQGEFTAQDLFNMVYAKKIEQDFANGQLNENGEPLSPNEYEQLTPKQAKENAEKTGCDIFVEKKTRL